MQIKKPSWYKRKGQFCGGFSWVNLRRIYLIYNFCFCFCLFLFLRRIQRHCTSSKFRRSIWLTLCIYFLSFGSHFFPLINHWRNLIISTSIILWLHIFSFGLFSRMSMKLSCSEKPKDTTSFEWVIKETS